MNNPSLRLELLPAMRVGRFRAVGATPQREAWDQLQRWAAPRGWLTEPRMHPIFGFNNPGPVPENPEYGYEFWIGLGPDDETAEGVSTLAFPGGWYAVAAIRGLPDPDAWRRLWEWVGRSPVRHRREHELERPLNPLAAEEELKFELWLPIEARAENPPADSPELAAVRAFIAAINAHDVAALEALMTEDHTFVDPVGTVVSGRVAMASGWRQYLVYFPDYMIRGEVLLQDRGTVAVFGSWTATYAGKGGLLPKNAVGGPAAWRAVVADGRIKIWQVVADHSRTIEVMKRDADPAAAPKAPGAAS